MSAGHVVTIGFTCPCGELEKPAAKDCTLVRLIGSMWLESQCPRLGLVRVEIADSLITTILATPVVVHPAVRGYLREKTKEVTPRSPLLTPANLHTLRMLRRFIKREGRAPSLAELGVECAIGKTAARFQLVALMEKGAIERDPGKPRAIRILS